MKCNHDDCFTCPFPDCIKNRDDETGEKKKPGRKKMEPEELKKRRLDYQKKYYQAHKDEASYKEYVKKYYQEHKEEYRARERKNRQKKKEV